MKKKKLTNHPSGEIRYIGGFLYLNPKYQLYNGLKYFNKALKGILHVKNSKEKQK